MDTASWDGAFKAPWLMAPDAMALQFYALEVELLQA